PFVGGRHLQQITAHLEACSRGEIKTLVISVPPGCSKSSTTGVFWPVWDWACVPRPDYRPNPMGTGNPSPSPYPWARRGPAEKPVYGWRKWLTAAYSPSLTHR